MEHHHHHDEDTVLAELLDLDAEVLHALLDEIVDWVHDLAGDPRRVLDLGAGTGAGTFALARRITAADIIAVDMSATMLHRLRHAAAALGVADRIELVEADLDTAWPALAPVDLVWAANSLHHMADPDRTLAEVFAAIRPGGLFAAVEMDAFPRFLSGEGPAATAEAALEARCHAAMAALRAGDMPHFGADWGPRLRQAGFTVEAERRFTAQEQHPKIGRYAQATLRRIRGGLGDRLDAADLAALDRLAEEVPHRTDLTIRATRTVWAARR